MTNEEAKRQLESAYPYLSNEVKLALDKVIDALGDCYIIPKNSTWIIDGIDVQEAIEKQKPKKPVVFTSIEKSFRCPNCETEIMSIDKVNCQWGHEQLYCECCGQAIDWSEDND